MKKSEIKEGGHYKALVSGRVVTVLVDKIEQLPYPNNKQVQYRVTNTRTNKKLVFRTAARFHAPMKVVETVPAETNPVPESASLPQKETMTTTYGEKRSALADKLRTKSDPGIDTAPHIIVEARAGTGKTFTMVVGVKAVKGFPIEDVVPSPQQQVIWDSMVLSKDKAHTIAICAFNKSIADEVEAKVKPYGVDAGTTHRFGNRALFRSFGKLPLNDKRVENIIASILDRDIYDLRRTKFEVLRLVETLVSKCKQNLIPESLGVEQFNWADELDKLSSQYDIDLNGSRDEVYDLVPKVLDRCKDVNKDRCINYDDMIWLPVVLDLAVYRYDLLLVDEAQDLNRCQQALVKKAGRRLILVGDPKQAIYGFAGADADSMPRMQRELGATERGCITLPLTMTRRCGKAIVKEAQKLVPDFEAHENNPEGKISHYKLVRGATKTAEQAASDYGSWVMDGDMVLCRCNAPLVSECFKFLKAGRKANIQGRDVGKGLVSTINKLKAHSLESLITKLDNWLDSETKKENAKRNPSESRLIALQDRHDCLTCFINGTVMVNGVEKQIESVDEVIAKINSVFTDDRDNRGILLSSIHKSKGLESSRVFLLQLKTASVPHPMAKTPEAKEQELNLLYVGITRAINEFAYVSDN